MPELPEVETVARRLAPSLVGDAIESIHALRADIVREGDPPAVQQLVGKRISGVSRRAKYLLLHFESGSKVLVHLRMTGRLHHCPRDLAVPPHTHARFWLQSGGELRFTDVRRFGGLYVYLPGDAALQNRLDALGPEPLDIEAEALHERLSKTHRAVKSALLDQTVVAGLGNIYVDESLFQAKIHPVTPASSLSLAEVTRLVAVLKSLLLRAIEAGGSTVNNYMSAWDTAGTYQTELQVYRRTGHACVVCGTPIERIILGGRSTHLCPSCQPTPKSTA